MIRAIMSGGELPQSSVNDIDNPENFISVYPNPSTDVLNFNLENKIFEDFNLEIYNSLGQKIFAEQLMQQIDIQHFTKGIYFAKIQHKRTAETTMVQFIKQ